MKLRLFAIVLTLFLLLPVISVSSAATNSSTGSVLIKAVNPIPAVITIPESVIVVEKDNLTLADVSLPDGWEWVDSTLTAVNGESYLATYTGADAAGQIINANITVTTSKCTHSESSEWVSNKDRTFFRDGTKTRVCPTCGESETVTDVDSSILSSILGWFKDIFSTVFCSISNQSI